METEFGWHGAWGGWGRQEWDCEWAGPEGGVWIQLLGWILVPIPGLGGPNPDAGILLVQV